MTGVPDSPPTHPSEAARGSAPRSPEGRQSWWNTRPLLLIVIMGAFSVLYFSLSYARLTEFYTNNWDLGINMQSAWTTTHGYLAYSAGNYEFVGAGTFFFIHPSYVLIPVSGLYALAPFATTLFALQAIIVASSAIPLYLVGRSARVPDWLLLAGLVVYLASFPILSALLFDFHWEALIPAEFVWTYYLWNRGRYWLALVPATLGLFTLEVFPVLLAGLVAYFGYPFFLSFVRSPGASLRWLWRQPRKVVPLVGLLAFAAVGYFALSLFASHVLPAITGTTPTIPLATSYDFLGVYWWGTSAATIGPRLLYWLLLSAAFGFLPLLFRQRLLILSLPWFLYSVIMIPFSAYTQFGYQYAFIAVGPLAIAFVEALGTLGRLEASSTAKANMTPGTWFVLLLPFCVASVVDSLALIRAFTRGVWIGVAMGAFTLAGYLALRYHVSASSTASQEPRILRRRGGPRSAEWVKGVLIGALIVLVVGNLAMSPLNSRNFQGEGFGGYSLGYHPNPLYRYMSSMAGKIPAGAQVVASDNLFPFVANNPNAYSFLWYPAPPPYFPFNGSHLPRYAFISWSQWFAVPQFLRAILFNQSVYGVIETLYSTGSFPGTIYLLQLGYTGPVEVIPVSPYPRSTLICGDDFDLGASGRIVPMNGTACGEVIQSRPASNLSGNNATIWYGPYATLLPGQYTVTLSLKGDFPVPLTSPAYVIF
ncbi:MAG: DUF2079 domain-containing protein, partial [Thermoplasmata archaeon]